MARNSTRFDLSNRLIHFTRKVDTGADEAAVVELPTEWPFGTLVEEGALSPFFLLRRIVRTRQIVSTFSYRNGKPNVYGPDPAACFTEMPLAAFLTASRLRAARGEHVSCYALLLRKDDAFAAGARSVIYALSGDVWAVDGAGGSRLLPADRLPLEEQYRFIAYDPTLGGRLDFTHEREWRWPNRIATRFLDYDVPDISDARRDQWNDWSNRRARDRAAEDGLCLDSSGFTDVGILVKTQRQADLIVRDVVWLVDAKVIGVNLYTFVLVGSELDPSELIDPAHASATIAESTLDLAPHFDEQTDDARLRSMFDEIVAAALDALDPTDGQRDRGECWLWLVDNTHPLTRALLRDGRVLVSKLRPRYLVKLHAEIGLSLAARESVARTVASRVMEKFGTDATYFRVERSDDIDDVPFYTDMKYVDERYLNRAHNAEDF